MYYTYCDVQRKREGGREGGVLYIYVCVCVCVCIIKPIHTHTKREYTQTNIHFKVTAVKVHSDIVACQQTVSSRKD